MHEVPLISTLVAGLGVAFILGTLAQRLHISPLVGYLLAGVVVGPATPGIMADPALAAEIAELGVILLMFGVGLHFSLADLLSVRAIAIPGAVVQIAIATILGLGLALLLGWSVPAGLVFGLALSVASTVVLLRALQERRMVETQQGHIAVGWLIVEDLAMVVALVLIPALAGGAADGDHDPAVPSDLGGIAVAIGLTLVKVAAFVALMLIVGRRVIPWIMHVVAHMGSRELFRLAVLAIALGIAYGAAVLFGVSFALGAFFAGMVLAESPLSQRAAEESLPFRDAFAVLFFVSVGMLFDPRILVNAPLAVAATVAIILFGKSVAAYAIVRLFKHSHTTALTIAASLAQVGEFSFILAGLGVTLGILPEEGRSLVLAGALISIVVNPLGFDFLVWWSKRRAALAGAPAAAAPVPLEPTALTGHAVIVGFGRVGSFAGERLLAAGVPLFVIEQSAEQVVGLGARGIETVSGNAAAEPLLDAANIKGARWLVVAIPEAFEASAIVRDARAANPGLVIVARAHFDAEVVTLKADGANVVIMGEREIAEGMVAEILRDRSGTPGAAPAPSAA